MQGIPLPTVARLLGHRQVRMTLRYAHIHDAEVEAAAERIGETITRICPRVRPRATPPIAASADF